ncbi:type IV toxin-antitoxin system AbiEi family antitoxin domain-containing protein [Isoptericola dokdonensis]|uniref:DUF559 domain-containing protein n=1 Tax=Isoptericola dokdonensis DS-3 TaxID=1300344 RepID=A0A161I0B6_9MICO|nr:type IV toxin-antitoxin system AbiEi family antitoxin domain-containing protein [Isoptericola dokdonensis]ANC32453.1 hypothetical protein I598_2936 [Isoptericola dokdonensis DS-3]
MSGRPSPLPVHLVALAARQEGLLAVRQCAAAGLTNAQVAARVRAKEWERPVRGVVDLGPPPGAADGPDRRRRRSAVLGLLAHPGSVATGLCALVLHGAQGAPLSITPEVSVPTGAPRATRSGVRLRRSPVADPVLVDGLLPCVPVDRALTQAVPEVGRRHAVALMDSALHQGLVTRAGLAAAHRAAAGRRGVARTHEWWSQADGRAESPAETWARLSCLDEGVPPDVVQLPFLAGGRVGRVDLAWLLPDGTWLLVEVDGQEVHSLPRAVFRDRERQNLLVTRRTVVRRCTGADAWHGRVGVEVSALLRESGWRPRPVRPDVVLRLP